MGTALAGGGASDEALARLDLCDNGDFEAGGERLPGEAFERIAWWRPVLLGDEGWDRAPRGWPAVAGRAAGLLPRVEDGALWLAAGGALLAQPVAGYGPAMEGVELRGRVRGAGRLLVRGGDGVLFEAALDGDATWRDFTWSPPAAGPPLVPRFEVALGAAEEGDAWFDDVEVWVPLPAPSPGALQQEVEGLVVELLDELLERGHDHYGPRETGFWVALHDVDTGEPTGAPFSRAGLTPVHGNLVAAVRAGLGQRAGPSGVTLGARLRSMTAEFLELCIQPETHLPRRYDPVRDVPVDGEAIEVAAYLGFLIDLAGGSSLGHSIESAASEAGDAALTQALTPELQAQAFEAALVMGRKLVEVAVLSDGNVAALVRPSDGWTSTDVVHLRRLDVPAQFVRLAALLRTKDLEPELQSALLAAALDAVFEVEYANYWPGSWSAIDPGFDDSYGHIGARSQTMLSAWPEQPALGRLALGGRAKYTPLWRQALEFGGNIAADQVRCWRVFAELAAATPGAPESAALPGLQAAAVRMHFKGEATTTGRWLDVTVVGFDPATNLPVGDVIGLPQNQLAGLATVRHAGLGLDPEETRVLFTTLLRTSLRDYRGRYGIAGGTRSSLGSIRMLPGLLGWLR